MKTTGRHSKISSLTILFVLFLVTVYMASGLPKLETKNNYESDLPDSDGIIIQNHYLEEVFGKRDELILVVCATDILRPSTLEKIDEMTEQVKEIPGVVPYDVWSLSTAGHIDYFNGNLKTGPLMRNIPADDREIESLRREIQDDFLIDGRLISRDKTRAVILAYLDEGYDQSVVTEEAKKIAMQFSGPEDIYILGEPVIGDEVDLAIEGDIRKLFPLAFGLILVLFFLFFRSFAGVVLPAGVIILSVVWTMGLAGHLGFPLTVVSSAIPVLLVAVASSYGIHVIHSYQLFARTSDSVKDAVSQAVRSIRRPVIITGITSAIGSATLLAFRVSSIREFGILSTAGFVFAMVLALTFVPSVLSFSAKKKIVSSNSKSFKGSISDTFLDIMKHMPVTNRKAVFLFCVLVTAVSIIGTAHLRVGMDPVDYFPSDFPFSRNIADFDEHFDGARKMYVMVESQTGNVKNPELLKNIRAFQTEAEQNEIVGGSLSFADVIRKTTLVLHENDSEYDKIPDTETEVAQAALVYASAVDPEKYESIVSHDFMKTKITLDVRTSDVEAHKELYTQLRTSAERIFGRDTRITFGGMMMVWIAQIRYIVYGKLFNISLSLILLMAVTALVFRAWKLGLLAILPVSLAMLLNFGIMGFSGIRLNMATVIITAMGAGIGVDFAVHYLFRIRDNLKSGMLFQNAVNATVDSSGKAILVDMISNLVGFSVFMVSPFQPVCQFGWLICVTMIASAFGALILIPASMSIFYGETADEKKRSFIFPVTEKIAK